jgi:hypothetical protein
MAMSRYEDSEERAYDVSAIFDFDISPLRHDYAIAAITPDAIMRLPLMPR